jgi:transposase-like protein
MTRFENDTAFGEVIEVILENGLEGLAEAMSIVINQAMKVERSRVLRASPYERSTARIGYANGYKPKSLNSRVGKLFLSVPQVRGEGVEFYPTALDKGIRSERALKVALAEMYVQGVSTRKVTKVLEELCGLEISSSEVSRCSALLDDELEKWRTRPLGEVRFLQLDATYVKVRVDGEVRNCAVLIAVGIKPDGYRSILGVSVSLNEAEVHWREFLKSLIQRGLHGVELVTSDDHHGLKQALRAIFNGVLWNRCHAHLQRNATAYVPKAAMRKEVAEDIRQIFNAKDVSKAKILLDETVEKYRKSASRLATWLEENISDGFAIMTYPSKIRRLLRTTNMMERLNKEIKRRTRVVMVFPNTESIERLASALLMEISQEWESNKVYVSFEEGQEAE